MAFAIDHLQNMSLPKDIINLDSPLLYLLVLTDSQANDEYAMRFILFPASCAWLYSYLASVVPLLGVPLLSQSIMESRESLLDLAVIPLSLLLTSFGGCPVRRERTSRSERG